MLNRISNCDIVETEKKKKKRKKKIDKNGQITVCSLHIDEKMLFRQLWLCPVFRQLVAFFDRQAVEKPVDGKEAKVRS